MSKTFSRSFGKQEKTVEPVVLVSPQPFRVRATWGGKHYIFEPGKYEGHNSCIQIIDDPKTAARIKKNRSLFLEEWRYEKGEKLHELSSEYNDFFRAYKEMTGSDYSSRTAAATIAQKKAALREQLEGIAINLSDEEYSEATVEEMEAWLAEPISFRDRVKVVSVRVKTEDVANFDTSKVTAQFDERKELWEKGKELGLRVPKNIPTADLKRAVEIEEARAVTVPDTDPED